MPEFDTTRYISNTATTVGYGDSVNGYITVSGIASGNAELVSWSVTQKPGISPQLYFKYIKKKFGVLERMRLDSRIKKLERAFNKAVENGQEALGNKLLKEIAREARETVMFAKGVRHFIEYDDLNKHKRNIRGGHISDTKLEDFTRVIPDDVLEKKKKVEGCFDGYVIYHYWDEKAEQNRTQKQKMTEDERGRMRDPVLFGVIRESNRLYFIADWEDEHCDLTFEEMLDVIGKDDEESTLTREPKLHDSETGA